MPRADQGVDHLQAVGEAGALLADIERRAAARIPSFCWRSVPQPGK